MKFSFVILLLFSSCLLSSEAYSQSADEKILKQMEYDWLIAEFKLDTATISKMMDENFISIGTTSNSSKQEELDGIYRNISQRIKDNHVVDSLYFEDVSIKIHGNTAILTFTSVTQGKIKGVPFSNRRTRFYDVWIKKKGKWKAASSQGIPIK